MESYGSWLAKFLTKIVVLCIAIPILIGAVLGAIVGVSTLNEPPKVGKVSTPVVAVIDLEGVIMDVNEFLEDLTEEIEKPEVRAVVLRVNSPGGAVAPSQEIFARVSELKKKKPIVASMQAIAASGGVYASVGASKVFAMPGTLTGSIGVIMQMPNVSALAQRVGATLVTIRSGTYKDAGNMFRDMSPEEHQYFTGLANRTHEQFIADVAAARGLSVEAVKQFADGRVLLGADAKAVGLVDQIGGVHQAARAALELAGVKLRDGEEPTLRVKKPSRWERVRAALEEARLQFAGFSSIAGGHGMLAIARW